MPEIGVECPRPGAFPEGIGAASTTRSAGVSVGPYASLNLGAHVGDDPAHVTENRRRLGETLALPSRPRWLEQVHGTRVVECNRHMAESPPQADAAITRESGVVLAVMTADCPPVLLAARDGSAAGVAHAGWRGLAAGVIEATLAALRVEPSNLIAWLGPAISRAHYEVDRTVYAVFAGSPGAEEAFVPSARAGHWRLSLAGLARARLAAAGVRDISGGTWDTFAEPGRFFSYRRDGETGRMASLVWIKA
jgi:YfiH family protein